MEILRSGGGISRRPSCILICFSSILKISNASSLEALKGEKILEREKGFSSKEEIVEALRWETSSGSSLSKHEIVAQSTRIEGATRSQL